jgi:hypothetical protein
MSLEEQQLQMLRRMATLDPPPCFMGGYAEDALLAGTLTRPHEDLDWLLLSFTVDGKEAPAGYRMRLPADLFDQPPARIDDIRIRVAAPLALYQMREGIAAQGSFGEPSERQRESARALREELLSGMTDAELEPTVERLTTHPG